MLTIFFKFLVTNGFPPNKNNQSPFPPSIARPPTSNLPPPLTKPANNFPPSQLKANMQPAATPSNQIPFGTPTNLRQPTSVSNIPQVNGHPTTQHNMHQQQTNGQRMPAMPNGQIPQQQPPGYYCYQF